MSKRRSKAGNLSKLVGDLKKSGIGLQVGKSGRLKPYSSGIGKGPKGELRMLDRQ